MSTTFIDLFNVSKFFTWSWTTNPALTILGMAMLVTLGGSLIGLVIDRRTITNAPAWLKPAKFAISLTLYAFTLVWLLQFVRSFPLIVSIVSFAMMFILIIETGIVVLQVVRGTTSHFNVGTPFDARLFSIMGMGIALLWLVTLLTVGLVLLQPMNNPAFAWSLRLGILLTLVGMSLGFLMTAQQSPTQKKRKAMGNSSLMTGAHSVGVDDGGPGLPVVGWSIAGGDLRIAHFFGLHALQVLPLAGWLIMLVAPSMGLGMSSQIALVWVAALAYGSWLALLTWQALRGQPITRPDRSTLTAFASLLATTLGAVIVILVL
jgi:hypothetical protein